MVSKHQEVKSEIYSHKFIEPNSIRFIFILMLISLIFYLVSKYNHTTNYTYTISRPYGPNINIYQPQVTPLVVKGKLGNIIIEWRADGSVRIASSTCPAQVCVNTGWIRGNDSSVCVPNGVVLSCHTNNSIQNIDGVSR